MADVNTGPKLSKNKKLGKNKKKSWRAADVQDIEEFLEDERRQLRTGGLVAEKTNESLFILDTGTKQKTDQGEDPKRSKESWRSKPLLCYSLLRPDPHSKTVRVPDHSNFQGGVRSKRILERLRARSQSQVRVAAQKQKREYKETKKALREQKKQLPVVDGDLWTDDDSTRKTAVKPPKNYHKKRSSLMATVIPHPGASVNPSYEDHQDLLYQAHIREEKKIKKEKKIYNALEAKFPSKEDAPNEFTYMEEMSAGLMDDSDDSEDDEEEEDENMSLSVNPPVRREDRKTRKQKRVAKEIQEAVKQKAKENEIRRRENMILRLPSLKSQINKEERKKKERAALMQKLKTQEQYKTKRLGKIRFEEPDLDLKLSEELVASMREVKPEGHLLQDVYKSLQRRNIIEPRVRQKNKRKYKPKTFVKRSHKAVTL